MRRIRPLLIAFLSIAVAACSQANGQDILEDVTDGSSSSASSAASSAITVGERVLSGGILEIGNANANVTMELFVNHDSRYSRQFHAFMPLLQKEFVDKGTLKIDIVPVAFQKYPNSQKQATMMLCAAAQGRGMAMHSLLMGGTLTLVPAGVDKAAFDTCMARPSTPSTYAASRNVTQVPTYVINGKRFMGLPTEADLVGSIKNASR